MSAPTPGRTAGDGPAADPAAHLESAVTAARVLRALAYMRQAIRTGQFEASELANVDDLIAEITDSK